MLAPVRLKSNAIFPDREGQNCQSIDRYNLCFWLKIYRFTRLCIIIYYLFIQLCIREQTCHKLQAIAFNSGAGSFSSFRPCSSWLRAFAPKTRSAWSAACCSCSPASSSWCRWWRKLWAGLVAYRGCVNILDIHEIGFARRVLYRAHLARRRCCQRWNVLWTKSNST